MGYQFLPETIALPARGTIPLFALIFTVTCLIPALFILVSAAWKATEPYAHNPFLKGLRFLAIGSAYVGCWSTPREPKPDGSDVEAGARGQVEGDAGDGTTITTQELQEQGPPDLPSYLGNRDREIDDNSQDFLCIPSL
ncbi:hypothetical protein M434DRAFT_376212 [Hypoxylon sp. CO27-5]|nr:hypothetical protein M434DRAFT_376212 [Hypoxylon sp. CO27-5]